MKDFELKSQILAAIDDLNQYLLGNVNALGLIDTLKDTINDVEAYAMTIRESKDFDLRKYLVESKLLKEKITWDIDRFDDAADVSEAADDFLPEVKRLIQLEIGDEIGDDELEEYIEVSNGYYYRKARKNAKGSNPKNISITAKAFADNVIENWKEDNE